MFSFWAAVTCLLEPTSGFSPSSLPTRPSFGSPSTGPWRHSNQKDNIPVVYRSPFDTEGEAEERYRREIEQTKYGIERTDTPTFRLPNTSSEHRRLAPPVSSRKAKISYTDAGTLCITLKAAGWGTSSMFGGAFSLAWFSAIVPATFASAGSALFLLPFWAAGGMVAKTSLIDPLVSTSLTIGDYAWSIESSLGGRRLRERSGATEDLLTEAATVQMTFTQNGEPGQYYLQLDGDDCVVGVGMAEKELQRLADAINDHLLQLRNMAPPPAEARD